MTQASDYITQDQLAIAAEELGGMADEDEVRNALEAYGTISETTLASSLKSRINELADLRDRERELEDQIDGLKIVEEEMPYGYCVPSEEEAEKDDAGDEQYSGFRKQLDNHKEYMAIYNYWTVDRIVLAKAHTEALIAWSNAQRAARGDRTEEVQLLWKKLNETDETEKRKRDEMLHRLIDIRGCLWT